MATKSLTPLSEDPVMITRERFWHAILLIVAFGMFVLVLPILAWRGALPFSEALAILQLVLSWPVAIVLLGVFFLGRFRTAIDVLLRRIGSMHLPGGVDIQLQQPDAPRASPTMADEGGVVLSREQQAGLEQFISDLSQRVQLTEAAKQDLENRHHEALVESITWKWRYLTIFLVPTTKQVLRWFADTAGIRIPRDQFHSLWQRAIVDPDQREVILHVLVENGLLEAQGVNLTLSTEGYQYLVWLGMIPPPPPTVSDGAAGPTR